jgi:hypothetical protein
MALLPLPFLHIAGDDPAMWRIASGLYLVTGLGWIWASLRRHRARRLTPDRRPIVYTLFAITLAGAVLDVANVIGLGGAHAYSLYLASILLGLGNTGLLFLLVAIHVFDDEPE